MSSFEFAVIVLLIANILAVWQLHSRVSSLFDWLRMIDDHLRPK